MDHTNHMIVLSFRGSKSLGNWIGNLNIELVNWNSCTGCMVHAGFSDSWNDVKSSIYQTLTAATKSWPSYSMIATGHSLGAAIATIAAGELRTQGYNIGLYTYGSPMTGNVAFANFLTKQGNNFRVTHDEDIVPKLPGYIFGYAHVSSEYWITVPNGVSVVAKSIKVSNGAINFAGNLGTWNSRASDHQFYFNDISACGGPLDLNF